MDGRYFIVLAQEVSPKIAFKIPPYRMLVVGLILNIVIFHKEGGALESHNSVHPRVPYHRPNQNRFFPNPSSTIRLNRCSAIFSAWTKDKTNNFLQNLFLLPRISAAAIPTFSRGPTSAA